MSIPTVDPAARTNVPPADRYELKDRVWLYQYSDEAWHPGVVDGSSTVAVIVTYLPTTGNARLVDTVTAQYVMPRDEHVPEIDNSDDSRRRL